MIIVTGFDRADPIVSLLIAGLMIHSGYGLVKASGRIFLEAVPQGVDPTVTGQALAAQPGVVEILHLHVWEVTSGFSALSATSPSTRTTTATPPGERGEHRAHVEPAGGSINRSMSSRAALCGVI